LWQSLVHVYFLLSKLCSYGTQTMGNNLSTTLGFKPGIWMAVRQSSTNELKGYPTSPELVICCWTTKSIPT
jgi:hypothetical protein